MKGYTSTLTVLTVISTIVTAISIGVTLYAIYRDSKK